MDLNTPIQSIPRIGAVYQKKLNKMGIKTVRDLLWHLPVRYEDFSKIIPIKNIKINERCCVCGKIAEIKTQRTWQKKMFLTEALIEDKTGAVKAVWFNQPYISRVLKKQDNICLAGKAAFGKYGLFLSSPVYEKFSSDMKHTAGIIPVYPETAGLSSRWLRYIIKPLLKEVQNKIPEILPQKVLDEHKLIDINPALWQAHFPNSIETAQKAKGRFCFEELFLIELSVLQERIKMNQKKAPGIPLKIDSIKKLVESLPFKLTDAQRKAAWQILKDTEKSSPMSRLLEGDVGSGKTVVALLATLNVVKNGWQAAFMAPTEILAKQHFKETIKLLQPFKIKIALLTGKQDKISAVKLKNEIIEISREGLLQKAREREIDIVVGTHALIQDKVKFGKLALVIIDEQHRFGVKQRAKLLAGPQELLPHLLSMTATPIPRTLALTVYGDLDLSLIDELPKGRKEIITEAAPPEKRPSVYQFVRQEAKKSNQIFVICPRIEKTENKNSSWSEVKAVKEEYEKLSKKVFTDLKVEMLHGKMPTKEKEKIMERFRRGKFDILVSTSVVEVGVDIPNATVMLIEGAERFGLAQLYQFRGRVGRSNKQSYCFLLTDSPAKKTRARLMAIVKAKNGFELAEKDLKIRGPGSLTGVKQWGLPDLAMETLRDLKLVEKTRETAKEILTESPNLKKYPALQAAVNQLAARIHLE